MDHISTADVTRISPEQDLNEPQLVHRFVHELTPHPSYTRLNLSVHTASLSAVAELKQLGVMRPLIVNKDGLILEGYDCWNLAKHQGLKSVACLEYDLNQQEALILMIGLQGKLRLMNDFVRIELALELEPYFRDIALSNSHRGGQLKGLSKLTMDERFHSRTAIAHIANVSDGNVHKVKYILANGSPAVQLAVKVGEISINLAEKLSHELLRRQDELLRKSQIERNLRKKARQQVAAHLAPLSSSLPVTQTMKFSVLLESKTQSRLNDLGSADLIVLNAPGRMVFVTEDLIQSTAAIQEIAQ